MNKIILCTFKERDIPLLKINYLQNEQNLEKPTRIGEFSITTKP